VLAQLVELDTAGLIRRGGPYVTSTSGSTARVPEPRDIQVVIIPADSEPDPDIGEQRVFLDDGSPMTLLDFIGVLLPGGPPAPPTSGVSRVWPHPLLLKGQQGHRPWTPDEHIGPPFCEPGAKVHP